MAQFDITILKNSYTDYFYQMVEMRLFPNYWKKSSIMYS